MSSSPSYAKFLPADGQLQGLSYSGWQERWVQWALSANPVYSHQPGEALFAHGSLIYDYTQESQIRCNINASVLGEQDRSIEIYEDTPIVVNIMGAFYFLGDPYDGQKLEDSEACINACLKDMRETSRRRCEIKRVGENWRQCPQYYVQSRFFSVEVSDRNPYLDKLETPLQPGFHQGFTVNWCLIIENLKKGEYILGFGARGKGPYSSCGIYQLVVSESKQTFGNHIKPVRPIFQGKLVSAVNGKEINLD